MRDASRYEELAHREAQEAIVIVTALGEIRHWNRGAQALLGFTGADTVGRSVADLLVPPERRAAERRFRADALATGRTRTRTPLRTKAGALRAIDMVGRAVHPGGAAALLVLKLTDAAGEAAGSLAPWLPGLSHELRTPLNAIIGFTGTLLMQLPGPLTPEQFGQLTTVQSSARQLLALINDLLEVAQVDLEQPALQLELVDCHDLVRDLAAALEPLAGCRGIAVQVAAEKGSALLHTDRAVLTRIVHRLIEDAIRSTHSGAVSVRVGVAAAAPAQVEISVRAAPAPSAPAVAGMLDQAAWQLTRRLAALLGGTLEVRSRSDAGAGVCLQLYAA